ncbi:hypothetical protein KX928_16020 [Roseobacter sp. YSTF-M11]|uniref:Uncharacterized protein n=1 Tax=Roseobacter insulae TaxID=2859783 RepID=A0A9X1FWY1_9RHOB|nr:hypothetical protein [Roseobacter insulae]MBW4709299.1 hypothetical protein [Roseobacter insulae]
MSTAEDLPRAPEGKALSIRSIVTNAGIGLALALMVLAWFVLHRTEFAG